MIGDSFWGDELMMIGDGVRLRCELHAMGCEVEAILLGEGERSINGVQVWLTLSLVLLGAGEGDVGLERCSSLRFTP